MPEHIAALLFAADQITPETSVAMPVAVFWGGLIALFTVAVSLLGIMWKVFGIHADIRLKLANHDLRLTGLEVQQATTIKRVDHHSDLIDEVGKDIAVIKTRAGMAGG